MEIDRLYLSLPVHAGPLQVVVEYSQLFEVLAASCEIKLFDALQEKKSVMQLAKEQQVSERTLEYLIEVLVCAGYLKIENELYVNSELSGTYLRSKSFLYMGQNFSAEGTSSTLSSQIIRCLKQEPGYDESPEPAWNPERLRQIGVSGLGGSIQTTVQATDLGNAKYLLDLGGGHGFYSIALAQKYPTLQVRLFDLPQVIPLAEDFVRRFSLDQRIECRAGDFLLDDIGTGYDAILCANILHRDKRDRVLPKVVKSLNPGGQIILKCRVHDGEKSLSAALAKLLWHIRGGKEFFSQQQWQEILLQYGFKQVKTVEIDGIFATIIGIKTHT
jgi:SAM-dependent methyltransferase